MGNIRHELSAIIEGKKLEMERETAEVVDLIRKWEEKKLESISEWE